MSAAPESCERVEILLAARAEGSLGSAAVDRLEAHLAGCAACRAVADTMAPVTDLRGDHASLPVASPGAYALGPEVARGGMGRILAARDLRIGRPVAIKELFKRSTSLAARFEREARITARLQHPGIVPIYEIGTWPDGTPFYAMRMVTGRTLREAIAACGTLDERLALLPAVITACDAVAFAHARGIIHRDLTPSNILVGEHGETVVIDWGLAKDLAGGDDGGGDDDAGPYRSEAADAELTAAGAVLGTPAYMPPEQSTGPATAPSADVHALGAILYHLLAGAKPYSGTAEEILEQVRRGPPPPLAGVAPGAPRDLVSIVDRAMARVAADRYADAGELVAELRRFEAGRLVGAHVYSRRERVTRFARRHPAALAALIAIAIAGGLGVAGVLRERDRVEARSAEAHAALAILYEEGGRRELERGRGWVAAALLAEAYRLGNRGPTLRYLLARSMRHIDAIERRIEPRDRRGWYQFRPQFSADERRLMIAGRHWIDQIDLTGGPRLPSIPVPVDRAGDRLNYEATYSEDGSRILVTPTRFTSGSFRAAIWNATTGERLVELSTRIEAGGFLPGDREIWTVKDEVWTRRDASTGAVVAARSFAVPEDDARLEPAGGGRWLFVRADGHAVQLVDVATGATMAVLDREEDGKDVHRTIAQHAPVVASCSDDGAITIWRLGEPTPALQLVLDHGLDECALSSDGSRLAVADKGGGFRILAADDGREVASAAVGQIDGIEFLADDTRVLVGAHGGHQVRGARTAALLDHFETHRLELGPSRERAVARMDDGALVVLAFHDGARFRFDSTRHGVASIIAVSDDGGRVLGTDRDGRFQVWDSATGAQLSVPAVSAPVALSANGDRLVGWRDGAVLMVDIESGWIVREIELSAPPLQVLPSPDGQRLLIATADHRVVVTDVYRGVDLLSEEVRSPRALFDDHVRLAICDGAGRGIVHDFGTGARQELGHRCSAPFEFVHEGLVYEQFGGAGLSVERWGENPGNWVFLESGEGIIGTDRWRRISGLVSVVSGDGLWGAKISGGSVIIDPDGGSFTIDPSASLEHLDMDPDMTFFATERGVWGTQGLELSHEWRDEDLAGAPTFRYSVDEGTLVVVDAAGVVTAWETHLEDRSPEDTVRLIRDRTTYRVEHGTVVFDRPKQNWATSRFIDPW